MKTIIKWRENYMQVTLTIPDKNADSFLEVLRHISFVEIQQSEISEKSKVSKKKKKPKKRSAEEFYEGLKRAIHDVNEHIAGRKELQTAEEYLAELRSQNFG
jgi:hypothetical protein